MTPKPPPLDTSNYRMFLGVQPAKTWPDLQKSIGVIMTWQQITPFHRSNDGDLNTVCIQIAYLEAKKKVTFGNGYFRKVNISSSASMRLHIIAPAGRCHKPRNKNHSARAIYASDS